MPLEAPVITTTASSSERSTRASYPHPDPPTHNAECVRSLILGNSRRMNSPALQDFPPFTGHSPEQDRPLGGYAALMGFFLALNTAFAAWLRVSNRELPERIAPGDLALVAVATHKTTRLIAKDRVTSTIRAPFTQFQDDAGPSEVEEAARGHGLRRAIGELLICPYCLSMWISSAFFGGLIVRPRATRWIASLFTAITGADLLQIAYAKAEELL
jgi:hypothetical protein